MGLGGVSPLREPGDQRDRWTKGRIRHLRVTDLAPTDLALAIRARVGEDELVDGTDILYTLVVHPDNAANVDHLRAIAEPHVGGVFSPDPDLSDA